MAEENLFSRLQVLDVFSDTTELCIDPEDKRIYVVKHLPAELLAIYRSIAEIRDPHLASVEAIELRGGEMAVAREYISGTVLAQLLREHHCIGQEQALDWAGQICSGLIQLHQRGLVHRDVNPNNIIISTDGVAKLIDFGIARSFGGDKGSDTVILGTLCYAAPEQFGFTQSDARTDIYAVGVLLNVMLTGVLPNQRTATGAAGPIVTRCTAIDPSGRYGSVEELKGEIEHARSNGSGISLVGCGDSGAKKEIVADSGSGEAVSSPAESGSDDADAEEDADAAERAEVTIEEQTLFTYEGLTVTAKSLNTDSLYGQSLELLEENDGERDYAVGCEAVIVNNCMLTDLFASTVAAGKKANESLDLFSSELEAAGIDNIGQIEIYFYVYDPDTYETLYDVDPVTIHTSAYEEMDTQPDDAGVELYNDNGIRIVGKYVDENSFWGASILFYVENNSGQKITVSSEDLSINGFMINDYMYATVYDGKYAFSDLSMFSSDLEDNGITSIDTVELKFNIYNSDTYDTIVVTDPITFSAAG